MHPLGLSLLLAAWPLPPDAGPAAYADPANWPNDPAYAQQWPLFGFTPADAGVSAAERARGHIGAAVDRAWSVTRGSPRVVVALVGEPGPLDDAALASRWALNLGELPPPEGDGGYDVNGDGRIDLRDYQADPRVTDVNGNGLLDCDDLLAAFADQVDSDGDGLTDDVCGWNFAAGTPHALSPDAGAARFELLGAPVADGVGGAGVCPDCGLLPVAALPTASQCAAALRALSGRAQVVVLPSLSAASAELEAAVSAAADAGTLVVASGADRSTLATEQPGALSEVLSAGALGPDTADWRAASSFTVAGACSGHGPHLRASVASDACGTGAALMAAGIAGLAFSAALESGHPLDVARLRAWLSSPDLDARAVVDRAAAGELSPVEAVTAPKPFAFVSRQSGFDLAGDAASASVCPLGDDAGCVEVPLTSGAGHLAAVPFGAGLPLNEPFASALRVEPTGGGERTLLFGVDDASLFGAYPLRVPGVGASAPRLVDLDGDGSDELVVAGVDGAVHALDALGHEAAGFPLHVGGTVEQPLAFADLFGGGHVELIAVTREGELYALDRSGAALTGFPVALGAEPSAPLVTTTPAGALILVADALGRLHAISPLGAEWAGSPLALGGANPGAMAAADLDGDGWPEALVPFDGQAFLVSIASGGLSTLPGWPVPAHALTALIADLDRDGTPELLLDRVYDRAGVVRLSPLVDVAESGAVVTDLDGDGVRDWLVAEDTAGGATLHRYRAGDALGLSALKVSDAPGWPRRLFDATGPSVIADAAGSTSPEWVLPDAADGIRAVNAAGATDPPWPLPAPGSPVGLAAGLTQGNLVLAAVTRTGWVWLRRLPGVSDSIRWDGFQHDPQNTGALATPLPLRHQPGIGTPMPPKSPSGCCTQGPGDPLVVLLALLLLGRGPPKCSPPSRRRT